MSIYLPELDRLSFSFPDPINALEEPNGLLAMGGDLSKERLLSAYNQGVFPWYSREEPILWWSPTPRAVFFPMQFKPSRSLKKFYKKSNYTISMNLSTSQVIHLCGSLRGEDEMWLNPTMQEAYCQLASIGRCHSIEVWDNEELIGGLYGVQVGKIFCGESMFSKKTNASKIALWAFCKHFSQHGGKLIDCQILSPHTKSLGAIEIERTQYLHQLNLWRDAKVDNGCYQPQQLTLSYSEE